MEHDEALRTAHRIVDDLHRRGHALRADIHARFGRRALEVGLRHRLVRNLAQRGVPLCVLGVKGREHVGQSESYQAPAPAVVLATIAQRIVIDEAERQGGRFVERLGRSLSHVVTASGESEFLLAQHQDFNDAHLVRRVAELRRTVFVHHGTLVVYRYRPLAATSRLHREVLVEERSIVPLIERAHRDARKLLNPGEGAAA